MPLDADELTIIRHVLVIADPASDDEDFSAESLLSLSREELRVRLEDIGISDIRWNAV
ncbi:hypothetical protein D3C77_802230 [compost metagenome]